MNINRISMSEDFYLIADTHFGHKRIIEYCHRPFSSVEEMDQSLIHNWNVTVKNNETIIHLGDFAIASGEKIKTIMNQLNGVKKLIRGNHDYSNSVTKWRNFGFEEVITKTKSPQEYVLLERG